MIDTVWMCQVGTLGGNDQSNTTVQSGVCSSQCSEHPGCMVFTEGLERVWRGKGQGLGSTRGVQGREEMRFKKGKARI